MAFSDFTLAGALAVVKLHIPIALLRGLTVGGFGFKVLMSDVMSRRANLGKRYVIGY